MLAHEASSPEAHLIARAPFEWVLRKHRLALGARTLIMGVLNVTPDSFSDGGRFLTPELAVDQGRRMISEGADIIDVGGESTRPGATPLSAGEEQARVLPVIEELLRSTPDAIVSVDTYHSETARKAVEAGAEIVNDVSGLLWDDRMAATCGELQCGLVLMHTRGRPQAWKTQQALAADAVLALVRDGLHAQAECALRAGIKQQSIALDPGFGFGKIREENFPLLARFAELHGLGYPLLAGLSRKSFLRRAQTPAAGQGGPELSAATVAANTAAILAGAHIVRVHEVAAARAAADLGDALLRARGEV